MQRKPIHPPTRVLLVEKEFQKRGYNARADLRMGLHRVHIWHDTKQIYIKHVQTMLENLRFRKMEVKKHPEQGVWVVDVL